MPRRRRSSWRWPEPLWDEARRKVLAPAPVDAGEDSAQPRAFLRIDHLHKRDASGEMPTEDRMVFAVLAGRTVMDAVGQHGLEPVKVCAHNVDMLVGDHAGKILAYAPAHDARLAMVQGEILPGQDGGDVRAKSLDARFEFFIAGEGEIIRVAR